MDWVAPGARLSVEKARSKGFESVNQMSIGSIQKEHNSVDFYKDLIKRMHDNGMGVQACFVFGLDDDKPDIFKRTVDFCHKNKYLVRASCRKGCMWHVLNLL